MIYPSPASADSFRPLSTRLFLQPLLGRAHWLSPGAGRATAWPALSFGRTGQFCRGLVASLAALLLLTGGHFTHAQQPVKEGLVLWLQAEKGVTADATGAVSVWADQSSNANNAGQRTGGPGEELPKLVANAVNGKPVIRFDGVDDVLEIANSPSLQPLDGSWTVFFVAKRLSGSRGDFPEIIGSRPWTAGADKGWAISISSAGLVTSHFADGATGHDVPAVGSASVLATEAYQMWQVEENRPAGTTAFYKNGDLDRSLNTTRPAGTIDQDNPIFMGREIGGANNRRANIDLAEVLIYNRALPESERNAVATYLSGRYGLGFAPNVPPTVTITSSANNSTVNVPAEVTISATAVDSDGSLKSVEISSGTLVLTTVTNSPASVKATIKTPGTATFTATAIDNRGGKSTSTVTITATSATPAPVQPATSGLQLWLKADAGVTKTAAGSVSAWADQSPNAHKATQDDGLAKAPDSFQPALVADGVNGKPVVRFDGKDDFMVVANSASLQPSSGDWTVVFVGKRAGASRGDFPQIIGSRPWNAGADKGWAVGFSGTGQIGSHFADGAKGHDLPAVLSQTPWSPDSYQSWVVEEGRTAGYTAFYLNGGANRIIRTAMPVGPIDQVNDIFIGSEVEGADNRRANIDIAEILVYNRVLSASEREGLANYVSGRYGLASVAPVVGPPSITQQPQSVSKVENGIAKFSVTADGGANGAATLLFQWQKNGVDIPGAHKSEYLTPNLALADNGAKYRVVISNAGGSVTSSEAVLSVAADREAPQVAAARRHFFDFTQVHVIFSEPVTPTTALNLSNYAIDNGVAIQKAEAGPDAKTVILTTSEIKDGPAYTLTANNIQDLFSNTLASGTKAKLALLKIVPHYIDTFTTNAIRTDRLYNDNTKGAYNVEDTRGNPPAVWTPTANLSFNTPGTSTDVPRLTAAQGNPGANTGLAQSGSGDFSFTYGLASSYIVQVDAILRTDRLDFTSLPNAGGGIFGANKLSVFFRRDGHASLPPIGLYNGSVETPVTVEEQNETGLGAGGTRVKIGVDETANWHRYAVHFDQPNKALGIYVDNKLIVTVDLTKFGGGIYENYSNGAVGVGGGGGVGWFDNFQVGAIGGGEPEAPARLGVKRQAANIVIDWTGAGRLEEASNITGPWAAVAGASSPYTAATAGAQKFYRLRN